MDTALVLYTLLVSLWVLDIQEHLAALSDRVGIDLFSVESKAQTKFSIRRDSERQGPLSWAVLESVSLALCERLCGHASVA